MIKLIKKVDIFSRQVELTIKGIKGHRTLLGAFLTLVIIGVVLSYLISEIISMANRKSMTTITAEYRNQDPGPHYLSKENFTFQFGFQDRKFKSYIDESIYMVNASLMSKQFINNEDEITTLFPVPLIRCSLQTNYYSELEQYFQKYDPGEKYCVNWNKLNNTIVLNGTTESEITYYLQVQFQRCSNTTSEIQCKTRAYIDKQLEQNYISFQLSSYGVDLTQFNDPHYPRGENFYTSVSSSILKEIYIYMQELITLSDIGTVAPEYRTNKNLQYKNYIEMTNFDESDDLAHVFIKLHHQEIYNERIYTKLTIILGQIGGFWNALYTVAFLVQYFYNYISYNLQIMNSLFHFEGQITLEDEQDSARGLRRNTQKMKFQHFVHKSRKNENSEAKTRQKYLQVQINSIIEKQKELDNINSPPTSKKEALQLHIGKSIENFFRRLKAKLKPSIFQIITYFALVPQIKAQYLDAVANMDKALDILYIVNKLQEIDKLKMILLTKSQLQLFDFIPKPIIPLSKFNYQYTTSYFSILKTYKTNYQKAIEAREAFLELQPYEQDPINQKLIQCLDEDFLQLLNINNEKKTELQNEPLRQDQPIISLAEQV